MIVYLFANRKGRKERKEEPLSAIRLA